MHLREAQRRAGNDPEDRSERDEVEAVAVAIDEDAEDGREDDGEDVLRAGQVAGDSLGEAAHLDDVGGGGAEAACGAGLEELRHGEHPVGPGEVEEGGEGELLFVDAELVGFC